MADTRTEREKLLAGDWYLGPDPELNALQNTARERLRRFNDTPRSDPDARIAALSELLDKPAECWVESPFTCEFGINITLGHMVFVNVNCTFLNSGPIAIGERTAVGPCVQLLTPIHPLDPVDRIIPADGPPGHRAVSRVLPVTIGSDCWLGAGVIVMPGVTIGDGTTVGAGSIVTKSLPAHVVAVGNPARVVRQLDPARCRFGDEAGRR